MYGTELRSQNITKITLHKQNKYNNQIHDAAPGKTKHMIREPYQAADKFICHLTYNPLLASTDNESHDTDNETRDLECFQLLTCNMHSKLLADLK